MQHLRNVKKNGASVLFYDLLKNNFTTYLRLRVTPICQMG